MDDDEESMGIPEWVVTFGDMMSLLLTFFIMLVSMSEIKEEEKFQAMVESMKQQFGHTMSMESNSPGDSRPQSSAARALATSGRAKKKDTHKGGVPTKAPHGEDERVRIIRPGNNTAIGTVIFFTDGAYELDDKAKAALDLEVQQLAGKPHKIEIRGHTAQELAVQGVNPADPMDLGFKRSRSVMMYLVEKHKVPPERIRCTSAGASEPMYLSDDPDKMRMNPRAEVFLVEETFDQLSGTAEERAEKFIDSEPSE